MWELIWFVTTCLALYTLAKTRSSSRQLHRQASQLAELKQFVQQRQPSVRILFITVAIIVTT